MSSLIWTQNKLKQVHSEVKEDKFFAVKKNKKVAKDILSLGFLSFSDIVLSDESI